MNFSLDEKEELCKSLWLEYKDTLTRMCKYKLSNYPDEVEDVISDAFYYMCRAVYTDTHLENPGAWLVAVTNNLIKKKYVEIRKIKSKQVSLDEENFDAFKIEESAFRDNTVSDLLIERISDVIISELSFDEQVLYKYVYNEKLKMKEIADILNLTEVNVRQRNHRLSKKLKVLIKKYIEDV